LFDAPDGSRIFFNLSINANSGLATPTVTYETANGNTTVNGPAISIAGTAIMDAIQGNCTVQGKTTGLAVGLFSSNNVAAEADTFSAIFDDIEISAT